MKHNGFIKTIDGMWLNVNKMKHLYVKKTEVVKGDAFCFLQATAADDQPGKWIIYADGGENEVEGPWAVECFERKEEAEKALDHMFCEKEW